MPAGPLSNGVRRNDEMAASTSEAARAPTRPPPSRRNTVSIDSAITHPGSVRINVQEAFIVEDDHSTSAQPPLPEGHHHETKDIRLPNHTAVVSHVAVDVSDYAILARLVRR